MSVSRGNGSMITISISKIKKIIEIKKNFKENGTRDRENGSNPHSNGDNFSLSMDLFGHIKEEIAMITRGINMIHMVLII